MEAKNNEKSMPQNSDGTKGLNNTPAKTAHKKPRKPVFPGFFYMAVVVAEEGLEPPTRGL